MDPRTPVLVAGGQISNRVDQGAEVLSPTQLLAEAIRRSVEGRTGAQALLPQVDSMRVARILSWRYRDPAALVAAELGIDPAHRVHAAAGGHSPQALVSQAAADIAAGDAEVVVLGGAEAFRTRMKLRANGEKPEWHSQGDDVPEADGFGVQMEMLHPAEAAAGLMMPVQIYPMFDTAHRHELGRSRDEHLEAVAKLWSGFAAVAADNPHAWDQRGVDADTIATVGPDNRMICAPYPKLMNSNNMVEQGAAVILCSAERAEAAGIPRDEWVFPHAGVGASDPQMSFRAELSRSVATAHCAKLLFELAGCGVDDINHVDLYSCFPAAVQIGAKEIGFDLDRQLTVTGGLGFAGGPWNNYVSHSIATMYGLLVANPGDRGLIWGNGGALTKQAMAIYSTEPPANGFRQASAQTASDAEAQRRPDADFAGEAVVETYTVEYDRAGEAVKAYVAATPDDARRTWLSTEDPALCQALLDQDPLGRSVTRTTEGQLAGL